MIDWIVKGRLMVKLPFNEFGTNNIKPLAGVNVKVYAAKDDGLLGGIDNKWDEVRTDKDGFFIVKKRKNKDKRQFKAVIEFKDEDLKIYGDEAGLIRQWIDEKTDKMPRISDHGAQEYIEAVYENISRLPYRVPEYEIYLGYGNQNDGFVDFKELVIDPDSSHIHLKHQIMNGHASIWYLYREVIKFFKNNNVGFESVSPYKIAVKYPHNIPITTKNFDNSNEVSYSNPRNKIIFIVANGVHHDLTVNTLIHELMHFWMYMHCAGEIRMALQWAINQGTHDSRQEKSFVAFHEAFAEWTKDRLKEEVFGFTPSEENKPYNRQHLIDMGAQTVEDLGHYEEGWTHFFNMLTADNLHRFNLNPVNPTDDFAAAGRKPLPGDNCSSPSVSFVDFLRLFIKERVSEGELNTIDMLEMACSLNPALAGKKDVFTSLLDPLGTSQPRDFFCTTAFTIPVKPFRKKATT